MEVDFEEGPEDGFDHSGIGGTYADRLHDPRRRWKVERVSGQREGSEPEALERDSGGALGREQGVGVKHLIIFTVDLYGYADINTTIASEIDQIGVRDQFIAIILGWADPVSL